MTISTITAKSRYAGDGATTSFPTGFKFLDNDHVKVMLREAGGSETLWTEGSEYVLSGAGAPGGGTVAVNTSPTDYTPAAGETLVVKLAVPARQETSLPLGGAFPSTAVEGMADLAALRDQQVEEALSRALKFKETTALADVEFPEPEAGKPVAWNAAGDGLENRARIGTWQGDWATATDYEALDIVREPSTKNVYVCEVSHTSGVFATDLAANTWSLAINVVDVETAQAAAEAAQAAAETAETNAETAETNAAASAAAAAGSAGSAATQASNASGSASAAATSAANAATSETNAASSAGAAASSASAASSSATAAGTAQTAAEAAQAAAETAQTAAETAETGAVAARDDAVAIYTGIAAVNAAVTAAETAETNAETAESNAASSASGAASSASAAASSASAASTAQTAAETAETNAETAETNAETAQTAAEAARDAALAAALNWLGPWDSGTAYVVNDVVEQGGSSFVCIADSTNQSPPNATYWELMASQGDQGSTGADGAPGPQGNPGVGVSPAGLYQAGTTYAQDEAVTFDGSLYHSLQNGNQGNTPDSSPAFWDLLVAKGDQGDQGVPGSDGSGVPPGGTTGQALVKASATDGDVEWVPSAPIVVLTAAEYAALTPPVTGTLYFVTA